MNASLSRRRLLGLAAAASAGAAIQRNLALSADALPSAARPRLAVCIDALFTDVPFEDRPAKVKAAGVDAFEFWGWRGRDMGRLARIREELGMEVIGFACDTGGPLVAPGSAKRIIAPLKDALATARKLGCQEIIAQVGMELKDLPRAKQHENCVEAFRAAAPWCEDAGVTLSIETLNVLVDHKGYYLATSEEGFRMVDAVGSPPGPPAVRHLPPADHRGEPHRQHYPQHREDQPLPRGRRARPPPAGHRRDPLPERLPRNRRHGFHRLPRPGDVAYRGPHEGHPRVDLAAGGRHGPA